MAEISYAEYLQQAPVRINAAFVKLVAGKENRIRLISQKPEKFVKVSPFTGKPVDRFAWVVIDRLDGEVKILESGPQIMGQIATYGQDPDYGDPTQYDFKINRTGEGLETEYTAIPVPKRTPLTELEKAQIAEKNIDLKKLNRSVEESTKKTEEVEPEPAPIEHEESIDTKDIPF